jgi:hypothetical protein
MSQPDDKSSLMNNKGKKQGNIVPLTEVFVLGTSPDQMVGDEVVVCALVVKWLFLHVKFICNPQSTGGTDVH